MSLIVKRPKTHQVYEFTNTPNKSKNDEKSFIKKLKLIFNLNLNKKYPLKHLYKVTCFKTENVIYYKKQVKEHKHKKHLQFKTLKAPANTIITVVVISKLFMYLYTNQRL